MHLSKKVVEELITGTGGRRRFTQDSPILPEVWIQYGLDPLGAVELLLTPHRQASAGQLATLIRRRLADDREARPAPPGAGAGEGGGRTMPPIVYTRSYVATALCFDELVRVLLPMTHWWNEHVRKPALAFLARGAGADDLPLEALWKGGVRAHLTALLEAYEDGTLDRQELTLPREERLPHDLLWMMRIIGSIAAVARETAAQPGAEELIRAPAPAELVDAIAELMRGLVAPADDAREVLWLVNRNRDVETAIQKSRLAVKADAAEKLFELDYGRLRWAIIDSGIDAAHPAFCPPGAGPPIERSRVVASYDFSRLRPLLDAGNLVAPYDRLPEGLRQLLTRADERAKRLADDLDQLKDHLLRGHEIDWGLLEPYLRIPHEAGLYDPPLNDHGTHVAGILGADWREENMRGVCPSIGLYDLRVLDAAGRGDEFAVLAALQFVQHLNGQKDYLAVHGANLSLALRHEVANYACGRTPVCDECERLVTTGVVVVVAAGNVGYLKYRTEDGVVEAYQSASITDPGNADEVITVGATHRYRPHSYGVSFFSSRGPTGDGRRKPDLVAPGEKVTAPTPGGDYKRKDGTSMAAPHVSGAAAALMARYAELVGRPRRVKEILCSTATDLARERYFQGAGMVDILRALQSV
jgi:subtilisin family serine protease